VPKRRDDDHPPAAALELVVGDAVEVPLPRSLRREGGGYLDGRARLLADDEGLAHGVPN